MENQEPPKREPQFSDENTPLPSDVVARFNALTKEECEDRLVAAGIYRNGLEDGFRVAWKGIESKIDDGTLMVVKTARWIDGLEFPGTDHLGCMVCSACEKEVDDGLIDPKEDKWNFCPGCGAKIVE